MEADAATEVETAGITSRLAAWARETPSSAVPAAVIQRAKEMMLNAAGIGLAGSREAEGRTIADYVQEIGGAPKVTVLGEAFRTAPELAALANGTMVHVMDFDENVERRANHPSNVMFPTVMAVAEANGSSGLDAVAAFAIGCEVSTKLGGIGDLDEQFPRMSSYGFHLMAVGGIFGATAAAGRLMGLDRDQMEFAMGMAASQAAGLQVNHGTSSKSLQAGSTAMRAVMVASLAKRGFTGARNALEGENGFFEAYRRDTNVDVDGFFAVLGNPFDVIDPGVRLKIYPCGSLTHVSLEAMLRLIDEHHFSADQVASVRVSVVPRWDGSVYPVSHPRTGLEGKFSIPYCMAVAMVDGAPQIHHFTDEAVKDPLVNALIDRVSVVMEETPSGTASRPSTVKVTLKDGRELSYRALHARGHRENPVTSADVDAKFVSCATTVVEPEKARELIAAFRGLDALPDVRPLFASLGTGAG